MLGEGENNRLQADETNKYGDFFLTHISGEGETCVAIAFFPTSHFTPLNKLENKTTAYGSTLYEAAAFLPYAHQSA